MANSAERPEQDLQHWGCCAEDLVAGHLELRWTLSGKELETKLETFKGLQVEKLR